MLHVIRRARRRLLANQLFSYAANAFSAALFGLILLLLAGTGVLRWEWLLLLPALAAGSGVFAALKRLPPLYTTAQIVDRRLGLADTLSTAWFFGRTESPRASAPMLRGQQEQADRISQTLDVRQAIPFQMPRGAYVVAVLALLASSLFALRYGITRRLDLHPPLARIVQQQLGFEPKIVLAKNIRHQPPQAGQPGESGEGIAGQDPKQGRESGKSTERESESSGDRAADKKGSGKLGGAGKQPKNGNDQSAAGEQDEQAEQAESPSDPRSGSPDQQPNRQSNQDRQSGAQRDANRSDESSSLLSKMKDAFENLLSRVKPPQTNSGQQPSAGQNAGQAGKDRQNGEKPQSAKDGQRGKSGQQGNSQGDQSGEQADNSPDPPGGADGKGGGQQGGKERGSGIGNRDGDKSIKQAEQLAAMGKISEIIGKRSANVTGEARVEAQSTSQELRTPYAQRGNEHVQGGAEINRDEIPVALQTYVEKYFEQVRKQAK
jgi:hypothetical protein